MPVTRTAVGPPLASASRRALPAARTSWNGFRYQGIESPAARSVPRPTCGRAAGEEAVHQQQEDRAADRDQPGANVEELVDLADVERAGDQPANERAGDPDQGGDDEAAGIVAGEDQFGDRPGEQSEQNPTDDAHEGLLSLRGRGTKAATRGGYG